MTTVAAGGLFAQLAQLPDPRGVHGRRFSLSSLVACACAAVLCGQTSYAAIAQWARDQPADFLRALGFFRRPPADGAFCRLLGLLGAAALEAALSDGVAALIPGDAGRPRPTPPGGKTPCGGDELRGAVLLLSLPDGPAGGVLKQLAVDHKTNEHKAAFTPPRGMALRGRLATADAMSRRRDIGPSDTRPGRPLFHRGQRPSGTTPAGRSAGLFPLRTGAAGRRRRRGPDDGALRRANRGANDPDDDATECLPGSAGCGAGLSAGAGGQA